MTGTPKNYDLAPDGKRLLAMAPVKRREVAENQSHVTVMINFFDKVRRRLAGRNK